MKRYLINRKCPLCGNKMQIFRTSKEDRDSVDTYCKICNTLRCGVNISDIAEFISEEV